MEKTYAACLCSNASEGFAVSFPRAARSRLRYLDHVEDDGCALYRLACERNVEGIVAKHRDGLYDTRKPLWVKINPAYSQAEGREELFEELRT
jgi:ATP-dependent DNA ligase